MIRSLILLLILLSGCAREKLSEQQLREYIGNPDNGVTKTMSKGDLHIEVSYRPNDLVWMQKLRSLKDEKLRGDFMKAFDSVAYFTIHLSRGGREVENAYVSEPAAFREVISYLSFDIAEDLFLVSEQDTVASLDVTYARTFGGSTGTTVLAAFDNKLLKDGAALKLVFTDSKLGIGATEFEFVSRDLENIPTLKLN